MTRPLPHLAAAIFLLLPALLSAQSGAFDPRPVFDSGAMRMTISMSGQMGTADAGERYGLFWPGDGISDPRTRGLSFTATPVLAGRIGGTPRVSASYFRDDFIAGPILSGKPVVDPTDPFFRAYTVTWQRTEETDYLEWPVNLGAPGASDGTPYFYGNAQMFWVMNDLDTASMRQNNGCDPMGLEMRCLLYAPWAGDARENTLLLQVTYLNKGKDSIRDAFAGFFMDTDLRDPLNDFAGSDSVHGMVYAYDGAGTVETDGMPVALGLVMLQTPSVPAAGDSARWFSGWKSDARNIPVTAATAPFKVQGTPVSEPRLGLDQTHLWYSLLQGNGAVAEVVDPVTNAPSRFWYSGNPVTGSGWLPDDGIRLADEQAFPSGAGDQRILISAGPFDLAPGDTQQVTYAFIVTRGATPQSAVHELRDRADFWQAEYRRQPLAAAYRSATVRPPTGESTPGTLGVNARMAGIPADLRVEVTDRNGGVLADVPLDRYASQNDWVYSKTVILPEILRDGVNVSFISEWDGRAVRIPGRVSMPVSGVIDVNGAEVLEEGDGNGRIAADEEAKWFPRFVNRTDFTYDLFAQSYLIPETQWLRIPALTAQATVPSAQRPWMPEMGYAMFWQDSLVLSGDSTLVRYDVIDPARNIWWERRGWLPTDSTTEEWYDVLMTQVRGGSDERPGVRLLDLAALQDRWYVATISGTWFDRRIALHDSASGAPYFTDYGLDVFTGAAPATDGFRLVRGTIGNARQNENPVTEADLFVFNPRHVLLARSQKSAADATVSHPAPMPLTEWTSVRLDLPASGTLIAEVYNLIGQRVKVLRNEQVPAGRHLLVWDGFWSDGRAADTGVYLLRIVAQGSEVTRKILVIR